MHDLRPDSGAAARQVSFKFKTVNGINEPKPKKGENEYKIGLAKDKVKDTKAKLQEAMMS